MKFFEGCRPSFYFHGGKLIKESKTGRQYWRMNLVITLQAEEVLKCDQLLMNNYESIETRSDAIEELKLNVDVLGQSVAFFALIDDREPTLHIMSCDLTELKMTRVDDLSELWIRAEIENTDAVHKFVKDFAFQRLWVEFRPAQLELRVSMPEPEKKTARKSKGPTVN